MPTRPNPDSLQEHLAVFTTLLDAMSDGAAVFDAMGEIAYWNHTGRKVLESLVDVVDADDWAPPGVFDADTMKPLQRDQRAEFRALRGEVVSEMRVLIRNDALREGEVFVVSARPILKGEKLIGAVVTYRDVSTEVWAEQELRNANARLESYVSKLEDGASELAQITEMGAFLQSCIELEEFYETIDMFAKRLFANEPGGVYLLNQDRTNVERVASWGEGIISAESFPPDECWALRRGRQHQVLESGLIPRCRHILGERESQYVCLPMMAQGEALGILHLRVDTEGSTLPAGAEPNFDARQRAMTSVAEHIAGALANLTLREALRRQAFLDPLTQLYNRRFLERWLGREVATAKQQGHSVAVIAADLDHFKAVNDTYGHAAADEVLKAVANIMRAAAEDCGIAARQGGEELAVVLPGVDRAKAIAITEALLEDIRRLDVTYEGQRLGKITASFGVAWYPNDARDGDSLMARADELMYQAKQAGRDRYVAAPDSTDSDSGRDVA